MKKKILSILLALSVCLSLVPALSLSVSAANMVNRTLEPATYTTAPRTAEGVAARLTELIDKHKDTYWTSTGQPCSSHKEDCYSKYYNAWQCNGFARYIFNELFCTGDIGSYEGNELYYLPHPRNAAEVGSVTALASTDTATVKSILGQAQPGDFFQVRNRDTGRPHSMIVTQATAKGLWILDCNSDGHCGVTYYFHSWEVIAARYDSFSLYHSTKYPGPANPFTDVKDSDWFSGPVKWAVECGITSGVSPTAFGPYNTCNRAQVVTFLYAAAGKPKVNTARNPFVDVKPTDWYYAPVMWAVQNGITKGIDASHFGPNETCTRAQAVTFLYATAGKPAVSGGSSGFWDANESHWYYTPVMWAVEHGITKGVAPTTFGPDYLCGRAEIVTFLYAYKAK